MYKWSVEYLLNPCALMDRYSSVPVFTKHSDCCELVFIIQISPHAHLHATLYCSSVESTNRLRYAI